jgi:hypothetical protein
VASNGATVVLVEVFQNSSICNTTIIKLAMASFFIQHMIMLSYGDDRLGWFLSGCGGGELLSPEVKIRY